MSHCEILFNNPFKSCFHQRNVSLHNTPLFCLRVSDWSKPLENRLLFVRLHVYIYFIKNLGGAWKHPSLYSLDFNRWKNGSPGSTEGGRSGSFSLPGGLPLTGGTPGSWIEADAGMEVLDGSIFVTCSVLTTWACSGSAGSGLLDTSDADDSLISFRSTSPIGWYSISVRGSATIDRIYYVRFPRPQAFSYSSVIKRLTFWDENHQQEQTRTPVVGWTRN